MKPNCIIIHPNDNVAVAVKAIPEGGTAVLPDGSSLKARGPIPVGHKIALADIPKGGSVVKYGEGVGEVKADVKRGEWVHTHNVVILTEE